MLSHPSSCMAPPAGKDGKDASGSMQQLVLTEGQVLGGGAFSRVSVATGEVGVEWWGV